MKFITINTAGSSVEAALYNDGTITYRSDGFKKASATLFVFIDELLTSNQLKISDLDFIGVITGPGSFTGIRIGLTTAKTFGQLSDKKIVGVTYHEALAYNNLMPTASVVLTDAANGLIYASRFNKDKNLLDDTIVLTKDEIKPFLTGLKSNTKLVCGNCLKSHTLISEYNPLLDNGNCTSLITATIAKFNAGKLSDYKDIVPLYVRTSQAEANLS